MDFFSKVSKILSCENIKWPCVISEIECFYSSCLGIKYVNVMERAILVRNRLPRFTHLGKLVIWTHFSWHDRCRGAKVHMQHVQKIKNKMHDRLNTCTHLSWSYEAGPVFIVFSRLFLLMPPCHLPLQWGTINRIEY